MELAGLLYIIVSNLSTMVNSIEMTFFSVWNHTQLGRFNWSWFDVTTFEPYKEETSYENSLLVQHTGALALSSLVHVFRSLTPNARGIFILIAGHQLEEKDNSCYIGKPAHTAAVGNYPSFLSI